jgi:NAD(P)-dependent dehydrogenase (short-subunit alcohol dehydrogenase family)
MDLQLTGKVVAITGGSRGIGLATALRLAEEGASVAICGRGARAALEHAAMSLARELAPRGVRVNALLAALALVHGAERPAADRQGTSDREPAHECLAAGETIADLATFLVSPHAGWVSGTVVHVDGGWASRGR